MEKHNLVRYHVQSSIRATIAEFSGNKDEAKKLRAQGNLRLVTMSEDELWELATVLSHNPSRPAEVVYDEIQTVIEEQKKTAYKWISLLTIRSFGAISKN